MGLKSKLFVWRRDSETNLVKILYEKYMFNMLSIPREKVQVGDVYPGRKNEEKLCRPIYIKNFLTPEFDMPAISAPEALADISSEISDGVDARIGLDLLENFLNILFTMNIGTTIRSNYESRGIHQIRFQFTDVIREHVDAFLFGDSLKNYFIKTDNPAYNSNYKYFVVMGVIRSNSISIYAITKDGKKLDLGSDIASLANASNDIRMKRKEEGGLTYSHPTKQLAIGIELSELLYDREKKQFTLEEVQIPYQVRGGEKEAIYYNVSVKRSFIGNPINGSIFIETEG